MSLMMMKTNPITPPRELVREWYGSEDCPDGANALANYLCTQAAQWGADQELEACCEWLRHDLDAYELVGLRAVYLDHNLRAARRPRPSSLKEQAFAVLDHTQKGYGLAEVDLDTIRRALEALDD
jgi:hypothetical protein